METLNPMKSKKNYNGLVVLESNIPDWIKKLQLKTKRREAYYMKRYGNLDKMYEVDDKFIAKLDKLSHEDEMKATDQDETPQERRDKVWNHANDMVRIEKAAYAFAETILGEPVPFPDDTIVTGYIAGATAELQRYELERTEAPRFKKPTGMQMAEFALVFNDGKIVRDKLVDMVGYCQLVIDRLYDNGDIMIKSKREIEIEKP